AVKQVCELELVHRVNSQEHRETAVADTSLGPQRGSAARLLDMARGHWRIENELHWVKDVVLGEDACRVRTEGGPQLLAGLRNAALRHLAAFPEKAVQLVTHSTPK